MANIIRCILPDGVHRYKPFTVSDYRDFLLVRNDMINKTPDEQSELVNELASDYFKELPKSWQQYVFLNVYTGSIGKTKIPIVFECPKCGKTHKRIFNIEQQPLIHPELCLNETTTIKFKFPDEDVDDLSSLVLNNIDSIVHENEEYSWFDLDDETKENIISLIDLESFEKMIKQLKPIYFSLKLKCCDVEKTIVYDDLHSIFGLLMNPDEVFSFYEINHILVKNNYSLESIMNMIPIERSIALSLIEKEKK